MTRKYHKILFVIGLILKNSGKYGIGIKGLHPILRKMKFKDINNILFLDIETVSIHPSFDGLSQLEKSLWQKKTKFFNSKREYFEGEELAESYIQRAGIYAEFAKVVCITVAYIKTEDKEYDKMRLKSFYGDDEKILLEEFKDLVETYYFNPAKHYLSGHNIKEFDVPFLCRRMLINGIMLPKLFDIRGKKPWQISYFLDTLELWRFGDIKNYTSLNLLATTLGIASPKDDIDGSQVSHVYHVDKDIDRIVKYCEKDVKTTVQVLLKISSLPLIEDHKIESLTWEEEE